MVYNSEKTGELALKDVRVIEFTQGAAAPWTGRHMAFQGAEVIRIESRRHPDLSRLYVSLVEPEKGRQVAMSPRMVEWHANKLHVALNLLKPGGLDLAKELLALSDVVLVNVRVGVLERWGLGYDVLRKLNPTLVVLNMPGFGTTGPYRQYISYGNTIEGMSGLTASTGYPEGEPCGASSFAYPDWLSGLNALVAVMAALEYRRRTGLGQLIDMSQLESTVASIGPTVMDSLVNNRAWPKRGNWVPDAAPHNCYPCKELGSWCVIAVFTGDEWSGLCRAIGQPDLAHDPRFSTLTKRLRNLPQLDGIIQAWTKQRTPDEVMETLQRAGVPAGKVQQVEDLLYRDPHLKAQEFFHDVPHLRKGKALATGLGMNLTRTPGRESRSGATWGQDNDYVFRDVLALPDGEMERYQGLGAIEPTGDA